MNNYIDDQEKWIPDHDNNILGLCIDGYMYRTLRAGSGGPGNVKAQTKLFGKEDEIKKDRETMTIRALAEKYDVSPFAIRYFIRRYID